MADAKLELLFVEDNPADARLLEELLNENASLFTIKRAPRLSDALRCIAAKRPDAVLLDLGLPDSHGLATLRETRKAAPEVPIVIITGLHDEELAVQAVKQGAQDYLVKGSISASALVRSLRYAVERQRLQIEIERVRLQQTALENVARRRYEAVLDCLPVMVCLLTPDHDVAFANRAFREQFGQAEGRKCFEYRFGRREPCEFCESFRVLKTNQSHDWQLPLADGRLIHAFDFPFTDVDGTPLILEMDLDVTERKRFEHMLQEKNAELERANLVKDQFLGSMSHELRTPLNAILGFTETLLMKLPGPLNVEQEKQLRIVQTSSRHLLSLISDVLDLTKIVSGRFELHLEPVDAKSVLEEVRASLRPLAEGKGLRLHTVIHEGDLIIQTDRRALLQILLNLASNAIKFTEKGFVKMELRRTRKDGNALTEISVVDTGIGISREDQSRLFEAFHQVDSSPTRAYGGAGLGLHISQKLAALIGGRIHIESELGKGSRFSISLPAVEGAASLPSLPSERKASAHS